jgi:5,10-methylene-tetrahydrofolate dehydrogenase/methenyl tetrahydrofolate cyclohydrolase
MIASQACAEIGINSIGIDYPAEVTQEELIAKIDELNADPVVNGILVQLPLPSHIDEQVYKLVLLYLLFLNLFFVHC